MGKTYPVYISKRKEHSLARYAVRLKKDACLYSDVEDFMAKRDTCLYGLVDKLLEGHFSHVRFTDPEYPM
jgi:hypothetical protein